LIGCSSTTSNITKCVYPSFPSPNNNVKLKIKSMNDNEINLWVNDLVILKEKIKFLKERKNEGK
jgi:hypothetical protein